MYHLQVAMALLTRSRPKEESNRSSHLTDKDDHLDTTSIKKT